MSFATAEYHLHYTGNDMRMAKAVEAISNYDAITQTMQILAKVSEQTNKVSFGTLYGRNDKNQPWEVIGKFNTHCSKRDGEWRTFSANHVPSYAAAPPGSPKRPEGRVLRFRKRGDQAS